MGIEEQKGLFSKILDKRVIDLLGQRFGEWEVIHFSHTNKWGMAYWMCKCSCGKVVPVRGTSLIQGKSKSCKQCAVVGSRSKVIKDDFHVASGTVLRQYKGNAKSRGLEFLLTKDDIKDFMKQDCFYCGNPPSNTVNTFSGRYRPDRAVRYSGIDRIDSLKGYTRDNCVSCCFICNHAKSNLSKEAFLNWVKRIYIRQYRKATELTPGQLIDLLFTTDYKCWWAQEKLMDQTLSNEERAKAALQAQELNAKRTKLIRTIDQMLDFTEDTNTEKTYDEK